MHQVRQLLLGHPRRRAEFLYLCFHASSLAYVKFTSYEVYFMLLHPAYPVKRFLLWGGDFFCTGQAQKYAAPAAENTKRPSAAYRGPFLLIVWSRFCVPPKPKAAERARMRQAVLPSARSFFHFTLLIASIRKDDTVTVTSENTMRVMGI